MKWFKHESRANRDSKMRKLLMKYGFEGYGLYWYCVENICSDLEPGLTFELEHDCEILAHEGGMDSARVQECMRFMVDLGLFDSGSDGVITCFRLAKFLGESGTRNTALRQIIKDRKAGDCRDLSNTVSDGLRQSEIVTLREHKIREDKERVAKAPPRPKKFVPPSREEVSAYMVEKGASASTASTESENLINHYEANGWKQSSGVTIKSWKHTAAAWLNRRHQFRPNDKPEITFI